jgi:uncharacterized membrane protein
VIQTSQTAGGCRDPHLACHFLDYHTLHASVQLRDLCLAGHGRDVAFQQFYASGASFGFSVIGGLCFAVLSLTLVIVVLGFMKSSIVRLIALGIFAGPAAIAGYALVHGLAKNTVDSAIVLNLLCGTSGLIVAIAAMINLHALGENVLSR